MPPQAEKQKLRRACRAEAGRLTPPQLARSNAAILAQLQALFPAPGALVFCYVSVGSEPDTTRYIDALLQSGRRVCVPRCLPGGVMEARCITSRAALHPAPFGLLEPDESAPIAAPEDIALAVVPCVAADPDCYRLGHGGGYYDRYLPLLRCPVLCLCHAPLLQTGPLPREPFDLPVTRVLTGERDIRRTEPRE